VARTPIIGNASFEPIAGFVTPSTEAEKLQMPRYMN